VERYTTKIHDLAALLGMDSSMTITKIHPSLNELYGIAKNISDDILAKLDDTVKSLEEEKQKRLEKVRSPPARQINVRTWYGLRHKGLANLTACLFIYCDRADII